MEIRGFEWDQANETHVAGHNVKTNEAEEVLLAKCFLRKTHSGRYGAYGQSLDGRYLFIVFEKLKGNAVRVIAARDMADREKRFYRRATR
ncbi:MAG: BrnT family toxin [Elusimicrobia bacterium]|nr:BrnT family toxin [Elusimicrobiota bacterium]